MESLRIIKIGGALLDDKRKLEDFLQNFSALPSPKILVHGGGKQATQLAHELNVNVKIIEGRRFTDQDTLDIISMVYAGKLNKEIVANLHRFNCNGIGLTGADGNCISSDLRPSNPIDYGFAGDIRAVNTELLKLLLLNGLTPVLCALTHDELGQLLNTNADTIAASVAAAMSDEYLTTLYYCFDKDGVLRSVDDANSVIENIDVEKYDQLIEEGVINDGMLPKLHNAFWALKNEVCKVFIGKPEMISDKNLKYTTLTL